ncbi:MAG TPA: TIGR02757 family protein [Candidatus Krumholzibacteriaceae bacterium]|nr:TIGR02757 family protein [Candidatus Krumholzibacteriaceae bacterium]
MENIELKKKLEQIYSRYNRPEYVDPDPLIFLYDYDDTADRELAGLIASSLAFGRVGQILKSVRSVLSVMEGSPLLFLKRSTPLSIINSFSGFKHRWIKGVDLSSMLIGMKEAINRYGSLENAFASGYDESDENILSAAGHFVDEIKGAADSGCNRLLPSPRKKSACKRLNLYFRWMIRSDRVDPGGWNKVPASKLLIPLDTHMYRIALALGLTEWKQKGLRTVLEITGKFREISPEDPVKYDFALTRPGIKWGRKGLDALAV